MSDALQDLRQKLLGEEAVRQDLQRRLATLERRVTAEPGAVGSGGSAQRSVPSGEQKPETEPAAPLQTLPQPSAGVTAAAPSSVPTAEGRLHRQPPPPLPLPLPAPAPPAAAYLAAHLCGLPAGGGARRCALGLLRTLSEQPRRCLRPAAVAAWAREQRHSRGDLE